MTIAVSMMVNLNDQAIQDHATLDGWIDILNRASDRFTDHEYEVTWDDVYTAIAIDAFAGGDFGRFVLSTGVAVDREDNDTPRCPGITDHGNGVFSVDDDMS